MIRALKVTAVLGAAMIAVVLLLHAPFVRAAALRHVLARVERDYGLTLRAERLDYNLAALRIGLAGVRISASGSEEPFFEADYVAVDLPRRVLFGTAAFDDIALTRARVVVHRRADGTTNLPRSDDSPGGDPPALRIARIAAPGLAIDMRDEQADVAVDVPALDVVLTPDTGSVVLAMPADLRIGDKATRVGELRSDATFDGRALRLTNAAVRLDEASMTLTGTFLLIAREATLDVTARGTGDLSRMAEWASLEGDGPEGAVTFRAAVSGPLSEPEAQLDLSSPRVTWQDATVTDVESRVRLSSAAADVQDARFGFAGGRVAATAFLPFDATSLDRIRAEWTGVSAAAAAAVGAPDATLLPAATASGDLDLAGAIEDVSSWTGALRMRMTPGRNAPGRIAVDGTLTMTLGEAGWRLEGRSTLAGIAPARVDARGRGFPPTAITQGVVRIEETALAPLAAALRLTGAADLPEGLVTSGTVAADTELTGQLTDPTVTTLATLRNIAGPELTADIVVVRATGQPLQPRLALEIHAPSLVAGGQVAQDLRASGTLIGPALALDATAAITANDTSLGIVSAAIQVDGAFADVQARAPEFDATAAARIQMDAPYASVATVTAGNVDLARILRGIDTPVPIAGRAAVAVRFEGPLENWRDGAAVADVASLEATAGKLPLRLAEPARLRYDAQRVIVDRLEVDAGNTRMSASGELDALEPSRASAGVLVTLTGDVGEVARAAAATGLTQVPFEGGTGPVALLARVTGSLESPIVAADLELGPASVTLADLPAITGLQLRAHAEGGWLELRDARATYEGASVTASGRAPISWVSPALGAPEPVAGSPPAADIHATATNLTAAILAPFLDATTLESLAGSVDAAIDVAATSPGLAAMTGELRLDRLDIRIADLPVTQRVPTRIVADQGFARVAAWDWAGQGVGQGTTLAVSGQVRLEDREAAILADGVMDLRMLTPFVRAAGMTTAGTLQQRLSITGALDNPRVDGAITMTGGEVRLVDPRVIASDLSARAVVTRTSARIASITGTVNGGPLTGSGTVDYSPEQGLDLQLSALVRGMAMEFPEGLRSELDANLQLVLDLLPEPSGRLSGDIVILRGSYREPLAVVTGLLAGTRASELAAVAGPDATLLDALALDVSLFTDEDIIVNNNYGRFTLGADLRVGGTAAVPALAGRADLREGGQLFVGRNVYAITSGTIDFENTATIEPLLNIQATTRAGGEDIEVVIRGTAEEPSYELASSSSPELGQADLVSLLLTGRRFDDLAPGDAAFVGTQVLGNLSAEVLGFASRAVGLDTIRLGGPEQSGIRTDPLAAATQLDPTTRLTFGKTLGSNVELTFSQSLRDGDAQTWIVEYLPGRQLELRLVSNDEDLRSYGFRHDVAFGGPARPARIGGGSSRQPPGRVVAVNVSGDLGFGEDAVRAPLRLEPGDRFDFIAWQEDRDRLEALYRREGYLTARVTAGRVEDPEGVTLDYRIAAGPLTRIVATGIDLDRRLRARLEAAWSEAAFDDFVADEAAAIVRETLAAGGYLQPEVIVRVIGEEGMRTLSIAVERGAVTRRTAVRVQGVDEPLASALLARIEERGLVEQAASDPAAVEAAAADYLRAGGYVRARVTAGAPLFEDGVAAVPLTVEAGPAFVVGVVHVDGAARLDVSNVPGVAAGAPYDPVSIADARNRLVARYRGEAFPSATVSVRPMVRDAAPVVDVTFAVDEGPRHVLGDVVVSGNRAIGEDAVVAAMGLDPMAPLRSDDLLRARTRVLDMGLFRRVDVAPEIESDAPQDPATLPVRLRVTVEEWPALRLRYGFEVAEEHPETNVEGRDLVPGLTADLTRRTLFGRAITLGGVLALQRRQQLGRVFLNSGSMFGWAIGSSLIGERSRQDSAAATLVTDRNRVTWEQRTRVATNVSLSYAYTFERNHTFDTRPPLPGDPFGPFDVTVNIARLTAAAAWDTRDDPVDTTRGSLLSLSLEHAPERLGSDIRFVRELAQAYRFQPWRQAVFASAARVGMVSPLGGQDLLTSEHFFAGGARTVRGVPEGGLGERDFFGDPAGGRLLIVLNQEVRLPIYRWVRGVAFVDAGNVFAHRRDAELGALVGSVGAGLRLATPFALLRVDFAKAVWGEAPRSSGRWSFGIGHAF